MTIQKAFEIIKNEVSYESGMIINEALKAVENALEKQISKKPIIDNRYIHCVICKNYHCPRCKKLIIKKIDGDVVAGKKYTIVTTADRL